METTPKPVMIQPVIDRRASMSPAATTAAPIAPNTHPCPQIVPAMTETIANIRPPKARSDTRSPIAESRHTVAMANNTTHACASRRASGEALRRSPSARGGAAGCGGRKESADDAAAAAREKKLNLYIWSAYMPQDVLDDFTKQTGIAVHYDLYDSNEPVLEKLQSGVADYDLVVPSDYMVRILIHLNLIQPLLKDRLRGLENLDPRVLNKGFDPANRYSLPYVWGTTGYGYSKERVRGTPTSWAPLFDPANRDQIATLLMRALFGEQIP